MCLIPLGQRLCVWVCVCLCLCVQGMAVNMMSVLCSNLIAWPVLAYQCSQSMLIFNLWKRSTEIPCGSCKWIGTIVRILHLLVKITFKLGCHDNFVRKWCFEHIWEAASDHNGSDVMVAFFPSGQLLTTYTVVNHRPPSLTTILTTMVSQNLMI